MNRLEMRLDAEYKEAQKWGIASAVWALIGFIGMWDGDEGDIGYVLVCLIIFIGLGVWGFYHNYMKHERIKKVKQYAQVLANEPTGNMGNIASRMGIPLEVAKKELKDIAERGYFKNAHMNYQTNCIIVYDEELKIITGGELATGDIEVVCCKHCVGVSKVPKGRIVPCEFCGMPLEG